MAKKNVNSHCCIRVHNWSNCCSLLPDTLVTHMGSEILAAEQIEKQIWRTEQQSANGCTCHGISNGASWHICQISHHGLVDGGNGMLAREAYCHDTLHIHVLGDHHWKPARWMWTKTNFQCLVGSRLQMLSSGLGVYVAHKHKNGNWVTEHMHMKRVFS